jgi:NTP pyrophosphatase (non-canonical NTP hydrolase)
MTTNDYQNLAHATAVYPPGSALAYLSLGLVGEAGEVANKVKKIMRAGRTEPTADELRAIWDELGDVQWYIAELCTATRMRLETLMLNNVDKLLTRQKAGELKQRKGQG